MWFCRCVGGSKVSLFFPLFNCKVVVVADEADNPPTLFQGYFPFISVDKFIEKCKEVYFAIEDYSDATFIVVNGGLYNTFIEWSFAAKDRESREEGQKYLSLCRNNLETALANLNLLMPARAESIEALALGVCQRPPPRKGETDGSEK